MVRYYSPLRYPGGKAKIAPMVIAILQKLDRAVRTYIEPFAGGAGVAIKLLLEGYVDSIVINDFDKAVYSFWRAVKETPNQVIDFIMNVPLTLDEWDRQRAVYASQNKKYSVTLGLAALYLNRTNRSGILNGGPIGGRLQTSDDVLSARFNRSELASRVERIGKRRDAIKVYNREIRSFISLVLPRFEENAFVYFDPPYYENGQRLYKNSLQHMDHCEIALAIAQNVHCPWLVTYDNVLELRQMYDAFPQRQYCLDYTVSTRKRGRELAIFKSEGMIPSQESIHRAPKGFLLETL